ncbi:I78 family peptidase inhibitor [Pseudoroseicyclus tamaricis]|uniref:Peptidase inhibitor I78 family protein n=1 Tax=Pseudoroseicyclus tamaricis TaxID=2705421 RepID=A0A6B2K768_9RHOB|nr:I78 family peptidase inhibitor [Pseudoroseicyclus tamaricis]NDV02806.1 hypothetical protein [Pseudoroseicyclus tamaricis]
MRLSFALVAGLAVTLPLAACDMPAGPAPSGELTSCGADAYQALIGAPRADAEAALSGRVADGTARLIGPNTVVTMDYVDTRLNVELDSAGTITRIYCG